MSFEAVTIVDRTHLPEARVLARSFARHHDGARLSILLVDDPGRELPDEPGVRTLRPADVGVDDTELRRRAVMFGPQGLVSSLKPLALRALLEDGATAAMLLDADMLALGSLEPEAALARAHGVVLSPHVLGPVGDGAERAMLGYGVFNGGYLAVGAKGLGFLEWWAQRSARDSVHEPHHQRVFTQKWLTLVPALFEHHVLRDPGVNLMFTALLGDDLRATEDGFALGETPVRLYHFTCNFDPRTPHLLGTVAADPPIPDLGERPVLAGLCRDYAEQLLAADWIAARAGRSALADLPDGVVADEPARAAYRAALIAGEEPPNPWSDGGVAQLQAWLAEPHPQEPRLSRWLVALASTRGDLHGSFPRVPGEDTDPFLHWVREVSWRHGDELPAEYLVAVG